MLIKKELNDEFASLFVELNKKIGEPTESFNEKQLSEHLHGLAMLNLPVHFYFLTDIKKRQIIWSYAIESCLGYTQQVVSEEWFPEKVHPYLRDWYWLLAYGFYKNMDAFKHLNLKKTRYIIYLPIKKADGSYVLVRQMSIAFQLDKNGNICSHLNYFTILGEYKGNPLQPSYRNAEGKFYNDKIYEVAADFVDIDPKNDFTEREFKMLIRCTEIYQVPSRINILAKEFFKGPATVNRDLLIIKNKILNLLCLKENEVYSTVERNCLPSFQTAYDAAVFLKECGILEILKHRYEKDPSLLTNGKK